MKISDSEYIIKSLSNANCFTQFEDESQFINKFTKIISNNIYLENYDKTLDNKIAQIICFEEPDLLIVTNDIIYAIEHFRIDSSETNKKGSKYKQKYNEKYFKKINKIIDSNLEIENYTLLSEKISTPLKYDNLFNNLIINLENHYSKIRKYNQNIKTKTNIHDREIKHIFFIQYECIFPSFIFVNNKNFKYILPDNDINLINSLKNKNKLDGIFCFYDCNNSKENNSLRFIQTNSNNLNKYKIDNKNTFDFSNTKVYDSEHPTTMVMAAKIPPILLKKINNIK